MSADTGIPLVLINYIEASAKQACIWYELVYERCTCSKLNYLFQSHWMALLSLSQKVEKGPKQKQSVAN